MRRWVIFALLALAGCGPTRQQVVQADADACAGYGFKPGSTEYATCRMRRDEGRQALAAQISMQTSHDVTVAQTQHDVAAINALRPNAGR